METAHSARKKLLTMVSSQGFQEGVYTVLSEFNQKEKYEEMESVLRDVFEGEMKIDEMSFFIEKRLGVDMSTAVEISVALLEGPLILMVPLVNKLYDKENPLPEGAPEEEEEGTNVLEDKINLLIEEIIKDTGVEVKSEVLQRRFRSLVINWYKEVKSDFQTKETVTRQTRVGGLGLEDNSAEALIKIFKIKKKEYESKGTPIVEMISEYEKNKEDMYKKMHTTDIEIDVDISPRKEEKKTKTHKEETGEVTIDDLLSKKYKERPRLDKEIEKKEKRIEEHEELAPPPPSIEVKSSKERGSGEASTSASDEAMVDKKAPQSKGTPPPPPMPGQGMKMKEEDKLDEPVDVPQHISELIKKKQKVAQQVSPAQPQSEPAPPAPEKAPAMPASKAPGTRPKMQDIKAAPKLFGPVEELGTLSVEDFRRLAEEPNDAVEKIINKLELLDEESTKKKDDGAKALKSSPLYKAYADIMQRCLNEGKPFAEVIDENSEITLEELHAIMNLNKHLKY